MEVESSENPAKGKLARTKLWTEKMFTTLEKLFQENRFNLHHNKLSGYKSVSQQKKEQVVYNVHKN